MVRVVVRVAGRWYGVAGGGCSRERSWAWAVKPGAPHDSKLLLHCLLTRSGIIGLAGVGWLLCTGVRERVLACEEAGANTQLRPADWPSRACQAVYNTNID